MKKLICCLVFALVACAQKPETEPKAKASKITMVKKTDSGSGNVIYSTGSTLSSGFTTWKTFEESTGRLLVNVSFSNLSDTVTLTDYTKYPSVANEYRSVTEANAAAKKIAEAAAQ